MPILKRNELRKKYKYSSTFRACEQGEGYFGIFSNVLNQRRRLEFTKYCQTGKNRV
jgi:ribosomal protein L33